MIDYGTKHKRLKENGSAWINKNRSHSAFDKLFEKFKDSILVVSYRSDGIPSIEELKNSLKKYKLHVEELSNYEIGFIQIQVGNRQSPLKSKIVPMVISLTIVLLLRRGL